jgi:hypothetical protein
MGLLSDVIISIPIGITYTVIIHKTGEIFNNDMNYKDKIQRNLLLSFGGGMFGIIIASVLFGNNSKYKNRAVRFGLYIGSTLLLLHSIGYNWALMENDTKFIIMIITLAGLIWYTYSNVDDVDNNDKPMRETNKMPRDERVSGLPAVYPIRYSEPFDSDETEDFDQIVDH